MPCIWISYLDKLKYMVMHGENAHVDRLRLIILRLASATLQKQHVVVKMNDVSMALSLELESGSP